MGLQYGDAPVQEQEEFSEDYPDYEAEDALEDQEQE